MTLKGSIDDLISRLERGSRVIYDLNIAGHKCVNIFHKYDCEDCILPVNIFTGELKGELCTATKLFYKLERQYLLLRILQLVQEITKTKEWKPEWAGTQKKAEVQMKLF